MSAHDRYLANHQSHHVHVHCQFCGHDWNGGYVSEYGQGWLEPHEACPKCGSDDLEVDELSDLDVQELRLEARGEDF